MRWLAPALRGRISRRAIVHSPHTWYATAATFVIFSISDFVVATTVDGVYPERLYPLSAAIGLIGLTIFLTRPPELGSPWTHGLVMAVYCGVSGAVYAHAPQGSAPMVTGVYIPVLAALWIPERRQAASHLVAASALLLTAALTGGNDEGTVIAVGCFIPTSVMLYLCCAVVLDAVDAQGEALDVLALRDPLTGVGNGRLFDEELSVELTRHRSAAGRTLAIVDLSLRHFADINAHVGRAAGDAVLAAVARALTAAAPTGATIARHGGDRFGVILPSTDRAGADAFVAAVKAQLPAHAGRHPIEILTGTASYPADGDRRAALTATAAARRASATAAHAGPVTMGRDRGRDRTASEWTVVLGDLAPVSTPALPRRVARAELARDRLIWVAIGLAFLLYAAVGVLARQYVPGLAGSGLLWIAGASAALGLTIMLARPTSIGSPSNHLLVAAGYLLPFGAMLAAAPALSWVIGTALLAPLLIAARLIDRRAILGHLTLFTLLLAGLVAFGVPDEPGKVGLAAITANTWVLALVIAVVFEAAERQTAEIAGLVGRDPLTGAGNADRLRQHVADELPRHEELQLPFTVVEIEIDGFDGLLRGEGRGAANDALRDLATRFTEMAGPQATVARVGRSRFRLLLPFTEIEDAAPLTEELRVEVAAASHERHPLGARIGLAEYPSDGSAIERIEAQASARCEADDPADHDLRDALTVLAELHGAGANRRAG